MHYTFAQRNQITSELNHFLIQITLIATFCMYRQQQTTTKLQACKSMEGMLNAFFNVCLLCCCIMWTKKLIPSVCCMYIEKKWHVIITLPLRSPSVMVFSRFPCSSSSIRLCRFWKAPGLMLLIWLWASRSCLSPVGRWLGTELRWLWLANKWHSWVWFCRAAWSSMPLCSWLWSRMSQRSPVMLVKTEEDRDEMLLPWE